MTRPQSYSLLGRLTMAFALAGVVVLFLLGTFLYQALSTELRQRDDGEISDKLKQIGQILHESRTLDGVRQAGPLFHEALQSHSGLFVAVFDANGESVIQHSESVGVALDAGIASEHEPHRAYACAPPGIGPAECMHGPVLLADGNAVTVAIVRSAGDRTALMDAYLIDVVVAAAAGALLIAALGYAIMRSGLHPVREIGRHAARIEASRLDERLNMDHAPVELAEITRSINRMLDRLQLAFDQLSRFSSDVAHDMRTPLANIIGASQVILSRERERAEYETLIESNVEECKRLQRMLDNMLFLARSDHATQHVTLERFDVGEALAKIVMYYNEVASDRNVRIVIDGAATVVADEMLFQRAVANLLSNAVEHARPGTIVRIAIAGHGGSTSIGVRNEGDDIPAEHAARLFERFYRADPSRHGSSKNAGLGLAIVKSIMELHRGTVGVVSADGETVFTLTFPTPDSHD
ncbi:heavy metal sensor histidine kinase [Burkholderia territorii]|uniref:heavy metal sensor histidine kinase n=1 Tax=Burkholderia territorii TaxID=1503055 RepID=UPI000755CB12|nr:heavy metal sensor histidine kinase [Burkholderia territorii]KUZ31288.1 histidine kinase [Burkholderia territorii]KUZ45350.1 histidine kinase [Burkholderia territorii]KVL27543.1 histidine kinase [Burkholderia territorii]KWE28600.1 histidine kinase [Burkholderia territorii]KWE46568.1 histidine kinase [Burkholderia territorii]